MCLAIPGKVLEIYREDDVLMGKLDYSGVSKMACLEHVPDAQPGDYVVVHVGFALAKVDEAEARRIFELLAEMNGGLDEVMGPGAGEA